MRTHPFVTLSLSLIAAYRIVLSPLIGGQCRFYPTCSAYAAESLRRHGFWRGWCLATARILRCHPWSTGTCWRDPVPERFTWRNMMGYKRELSNGTDSPVRTEEPIANTETLPHEETRPDASGR